MTTPTRRPDRHFRGDRPPRPGTLSRMVDKTSSSLLRRLRDTQDQTSWSEFVALYEPLLTRYVRKKGVSEHDAQDVVQGVLIALLRKLPTFELDRGRGRFRTWLWQVTHNAVVDWARSRRRSQDMEAKLRQDFREEAGPEPDRDWDAEVQKRVLEYALEKIKGQTNPPTWACFEEHLLKGRPGADVGAELGMPANTVYVYAARVMARVREQCEAYLEDLGHE